MAAEVAEAENATSRNRHFRPSRECRGAREGKTYLAGSEQIPTRADPLHTLTYTHVPPLDTLSIIYMCIYIYILYLILRNTHMHIYLSLSVFLSLSIYIYIYIERERCDVYLRNVHY